MLIHLFEWQSIIPKFLAILRLDLFGGNEDKNCPSPLI